MCGICGVVGLEDKKIIKKMCKSLIHRGPDDEGYHLDEKISLGHRRLSIIDLEKGQQPVYNENGTICVIFNGEIYNYKELRQKLEIKHDFYTASDTEVLVHLYEEYGPDFVKKLNGMFAFAIWDSINNMLMLSRDPIGKKPLYYHHDIKSGNFIFASEIKAIFKAGVKKTVDIGVLPSFMAYSYVLGDKTMFKGINKLLAGNILIYKEGNIHKYKYWDIEEKFTVNTEHSIIKNVRVLLEKSAKYRMIADVPIGAFLSGGIDSSAVTALSKKNVDYDFHTFSVGFEHFSELEHARNVSDFLDTIHHEIIITPEMVANNIDKVAWQYDEPLGDAAIVNNYFLSKKANEYLKVVIAGEGGDEVFGGYENYKINLKLHNMFNTPILNKVLRFFFSNLPKSGNIYQNRINNSLSNYIPRFTDGIEYSHLNSTRTIRNPELKWLTLLKINNIEKLAICPKGVMDPLNKMLALDCKNLLPEKYLMKADKATMANSIEERNPLLDKNIIEYMFTISSSLKIHENVEKYVLRMAVKDLLPKEILKRKKQVFGTPTGEWMISEPLKSIILTKFEESFILNKVMRKDKIDKISEELNKGNIKRGGVIWNIFALALWYDIYFENSPTIF